MYTFWLAVYGQSRKKLQKNILFEEKETAHVPVTRVPCGVVCLLRFSPPRPPLLRVSLSRRRLGYSRRRPTPGSQGFVGPFSGSKHQQGMPAPCIPCLLCEAEHPKPNLSYSGFFITGSDLIASVYLYYFASYSFVLTQFFLSVYMCTTICPLLGPPLLLLCIYARY
jgi:hypothetical protein